MCGVEAVHLKFCVEKLVVEFESAWRSDYRGAEDQVSIGAKEMHMFHVLILQNLF